MLTIRDAQYEQLRKAKKEEYCIELAQYLRQTAVSLVVRFGDEELKARIFHAVETAQSYGSWSNESIVKYVVLSLSAGPTFDDDPSLRVFLSLPGYAMDEKLDWLLQRVGEKLRG